MVLEIINYLIIYSLIVVLFILVFVFRNEINKKIEELSPKPKDKNTNNTGNEDNTNKQPILFGPNPSKINGNGTESYIMTQQISENTNNINSIRSRVDNIENMDIKRIDRKIETIESQIKDVKSDKLIWISQLTSTGGKVEKIERDLNSLIIDTEREIKNLKGHKNKHTHPDSSQYFTLKAPTNDHTHEDSSSVGHMYPSIN